MQLPPGPGRAEHLVESLSGSGAVKATEADSAEALALRLKVTVHSRRTVPRTRTLSQRRLSHGTANAARRRVPATAFARSAGASGRNRRHAGCPRLVTEPESGCQLDSAEAPSQAA